MQLTSLEVIGNELIQLTNQQAGIGMRSLKWFHRPMAERELKWRHRDTSNQPIIMPELKWHHKCISTEPTKQAPENEVREIFRQADQRGKIRILLTKHKSKNGITENILEWPIEREEKNPWCWDWPTKNSERRYQRVAILANRKYDICNNHWKKERFRICRNSFYLNWPIQNEDAGVA